MYLRLNHSTTTGLSDRLASLWFGLAILSFTPSYTAVTIWDKDRLLLRRESQQGMYSVRQMGAGGSGGLPGKAGPWHGRPVRAEACASPRLGTCAAADADPGVVPGEDADRDSHADCPGAGQGGVNEGVLHPAGPSNLDV